MIVYGTSVSAAYFQHAVVYCLAYSAVALLLATLIFRARDLT